MRVIFFVRLFHSLLSADFNRRFHADPLPPSGLALAAMGNTAVEVEKVVVIPWVIEDFEAPLSPAWELSNATATPFVDEGKLVVPPGGYAVRVGYWEIIIPSP